MPLVNPSIAMSFRQPEFTPRNALAEYAQIQQIQSGQRQAEVADLQLEALRRDREILNQIQSAIVSKGGPPDLNAAADEMIKSGKPEFMAQGIAIRQKLADQQAWANYQKDYMPTVAAPVPAPAPASVPAPEAGSFAADVAARRAAMPSIAAPVNAMAPSTAPSKPVNALASQPDIAALEARYRRVAGIDTPGAKAEATLLLKRIDQAATATPADIKTMQVLGYPLTKEGFKQYRDDQREQRLLTPEEEAQQIRMRAAGANRQTMNVNTQLPASEEAQKEFMKESRQTFSALKQAPVVLENIEAAKKLVPQAKGFMGAGGQSLAQAASFLNNRIGTKIDTQGVQAVEELRSRLFLGILDNLKKLDSQPSQQQQEALQIALGNIGTDPEALPRVLDVFGDAVRRKVNLYNEEVKDAENRGVKFPYNPQIKLPSQKVPPESQIPGQPPAKTVVRTGTLNGRRVVQYSDGSTSYAD